MVPRWFDLDKIPFSQMPADDELWYFVNTANHAYLPSLVSVWMCCLNHRYPPLLEQGRSLVGTFTFAGSAIVKHSLTDVPEELLRSPYFAY